MRDMESPGDDFSSAQSSGSQGLRSLGSYHLYLGRTSLAGILSEGQDRESHTLYLVIVAVTKCMHHLAVLDASVRKSVAMSIPTRGLFTTYIICRALILDVSRCTCVITTSQCMSAVVVGFSERKERSYVQSTSQTHAGCCQSDSPRSSRYGPFCSQRSERAVFCTD